MPDPSRHTCRHKQARERFLAVAKQKKPKRQEIYKAIGQQMRYLRRNLKSIARQLRGGSQLILLSRYEYKCLLVIHEIYCQQELMYRERSHQMPHGYVILNRSC